MGPRALLAVLCLASVISWGECYRVLVLNLPDAVSHQFVFFKVRLLSGSDTGAQSRLVPSAVFVCFTGSYKAIQCTHVSFQAVRNPGVADTRGACCSRECSAGAPHVLPLHSYLACILACLSVACLCLWKSAEACLVLKTRRR